MLFLFNEANFAMTVIALLWTLKRIAISDFSHFFVINSATIRLRLSSMNCLLTGNLPPLFCDAIPVYYHTPIAMQISYPQPQLA